MSLAEDDLIAGTIIDIFRRDISVIKIQVCQNLTNRE